MRPRCIPPSSAPYCPPEVMGLSYDWSAMNSAGQQHDSARQHQPADRPGLGLAVAGRRRTARPRRPRVRATPIATSSSCFRTASIRRTAGTATAPAPTPRSTTACTTPAATAPAPTSRPPASRSIPSRSIPAAIRLRRCCRTAPASSDKFFLLTSANQIITTFERDRHQSDQAAHRAIAGIDRQTKSPAK